MPVVVEPAHTNDLPALFALLEKSDLPQEGLPEVSQAIQASLEWTTACPVTAQAMIANLESDT